MSDFISREAAISAMYLLQKEDEETYGCSIPEGFDGERAADALRRLPSVEPKEQTAKVENQHYGYSPYAFEFIGKCENCGETVRLGEKFCHECGAKLVWK